VSKFQFEVRIHRKFKELDMRNQQQQILQYASSFYTEQTTSVAMYLSGHGVVMVWLWYGHGFG